MRPLGLILFAYVVNGADADSCNWDESDWKTDYDGASIDLWGGFGGSGCPNVRCDPETETLWILRRNELGSLDRSKQVKSHEMDERSFCAILTSDNRYARHARGAWRSRFEQWAFKEKYYEYEEEIGSTNADGELVSSSTSTLYSDCLDACGMTCAELAANADDDNSTFRELYNALLSDPLTAPSICFERRSDKEGSYATNTFLIFAVFMGLLLIIPYYLACAVSQRRCFGFKRLNIIRNEFDDRCPCLAGILQRTALFCSCSCCKCKRILRSCCCCFFRRKSSENSIERVVVDDEDDEEGQGIALTQQPQPSAAEDSPFTKPNAAKKKAGPAGFWAQLKLVLWQIFSEKKRDYSSIAKQVLFPSAVFVAIWMLYIIMGVSGLGNRWNKSNPNFKRKDGDTRDYQRGQILSSGLFESFAAQLAFISIMQHVIVSLVVTHHAKLLESTRMAGLRDSAYWIAHFLADGVIMGCAAAFLIAVVASPGLFRFAGFADAPFGIIFALHWVYIVALVALSFAATVILPSATIASLFSVILQIFVIVAFFLLAPDKDNKLGAIPRVSPEVQRAWCILPQFAYSLAVFGFQSNRIRFCRIVATISGFPSFQGEKYTCSYDQDDDKYFFDYRDAKRSYRDALSAYLDTYNATCADADDDAGPFSNTAECSVRGPFSEFLQYFDQDAGRMSDKYLGSLFGMLFIDIVLYLLLAWYLNQVVPWSEYGTPRPWYFLFLPSYWRSVFCGNTRVARDMKLIESSEESNDAVEVRGHTDEIVVSVNNLYKTFGSFKAVDGISFTIASSEIFCVLGHNGSGKTTTISCLTGLLSPDHVRVTSVDMFGYNILTAEGMYQLRSTLGVCPQHDILFPKLTLKEHIIFFSRLKGKSPPAAARDAENLLRVFHLADRAAHLGSELSGGQKRKLSTAIALAGNSRMVVLDEPTAGMDPVARRELWTLLRSVRRGRALLLTTHYMDEAEVLGDRTAIMVAGKIAANGTLSFLKQRFTPYAISNTSPEKAGDAYRLEVHLGPDGDVHYMDDLVLTDKANDEDAHDSSGFAARAVDEDEDVKSLKANQRVIKYNVLLASDKDMRRLANILQTLDNTEKGAVERYAVNTTTLEDVFLVVGQSDEIHNVARPDHGDGIIMNQLRARSGSLDIEAENDTNDDKVRTIETHRTTMSVLRQMLAVLQLRCDQNIRSVRTLATIMTPTAVAVIVMSLASEGKLDKNETWSQLVNVTVALCIVGAYLVIPGLLAWPIVAERQLRLRNLITISGCDARSFWLGTLISDILLLLVPVMATLLVMAGTGMAFRRRNRSYDLDFNAILENEIWINATSPGGILDGVDTPSAINYLCDEYDDDVFCFERVNEYDRRLWRSNMWLWFLLPAFAIALPTFSHIMSYGFAEPMVCVGAFPVINLIGFIVGPLVFIILFSLLFGGTLNGTDAIQIVNWNFNEIMGAFGWLAAVLSPIGNLFVFLLRASGLSFIPRAGWTNSDESPSWPSFWACFVILLVQAVVFETLTYIKDRIETRPLRYVKSQFNKRRRAELDVDVLEERRRVLALIDDDKYHEGADAPQPAHEESEENVATAVSDKQESSVSKSRTIRALKATAKFVDDARVALSYELPEADHPPGIRDDVELPGVTALEMRKIYPPKRYGAKAVEAVQNVTFAVSQGECFGLLGSNGAGKSSLFSCLTRVIEPTSGDSKVFGVSTLTNFSKASVHLSVVNQGNTLWETLSCIDHLKFFARLRLSAQADNSDIYKLVHATLAAVELDKHAHKLAGRLSGGMKRKLCCACALVADPRVVLLDEPSAGLDPVSQRNLWNLLKKSMTGRSVILTTHSMLEADVMCDRIGIMCFGQLRCLGTPAHLKARYTSGYDLVLKLDESLFGSTECFDAAKARIDEYIQSVFNEHESSPRLVATDANTITYELGGGGGPDALRGLLAHAFTSLESESRKSLGITSFVINPASMEKVFLNIVAQSENARDEALKASALGRRVASELDDDDDDTALNVDFVESTCCCCSKYAHRIFCRWNCAMCCGCFIYFILGVIGDILPWFVPAFYVGIIAFLSCIGNLVGINMCFRRENDD